MAVIIDIPIPNKCSECPFCIYTADEKRAIGYCNTSDDDYYCKALDRFMEYDKVDGGLDILGKPSDCPLKEVPKCKDCRWWKESDGTYKRGVSAESKCLINTKTVYLGEGYCYKFEPKMVEEQTGENTDGEV